MSKDKIPSFISEEGAKTVDATLAFFLHECPSSMIPSRDEVAAWARVLADRGDEFACHAEACRKWAKGEE
ncbi:dioxygenase [Burkholderia ubonensis]|uniref:dioxygenase n=1 Tax=Burkholderia ubonensis TaxID=101571 RepID=UPI000B257042|nr:dioxygenase [Burkholderia ubonensis]